MTMTTTPGAATPAATVLATVPGCHGRPFGMPHASDVTARDDVIEEFLASGTATRFWEIAGGAHGGDAAPEDLLRLTERDGIVPAGGLGVPARPRTRSTGRSCSTLRCAP